MPKGKGTYGSKRGRPPAKRSGYLGGGYGDKKDRGDVVGRKAKRRQRRQKIKSFLGDVGGTLSDITYGAGRTVSRVGNVISNAPQTTKSIAKEVVRAGKGVAKAAQQSMKAPPQQPMGGTTGTGYASPSSGGSASSLMNRKNKISRQPIHDGGMVRAKPN